MSAPSARVCAAELKIVKSTELVPGDVIEIGRRHGPADCRRLSSNRLRRIGTDGRIGAVEKNYAAEILEIAPLGDRHNMAYAGCAVAYGRAKAVVVETGMSTEMGKIATLLEGQDEAITPLQIKLAQLGKTLGILALAISAIIFIVGLIYGLNPLEMFMTSVSLAVAAIPEGLPAIVTIVLAIGVQRLAAKRLSAACPQSKLWAYVCNLL